MGKVNLIISESFINNLSEYLIACGIKIPSLVVKIWKTDADLEKGNCQIVNLGSASLYQIVENLTSLYEEDGCAEICFNDSYCDECLIHSDKYELYLIDDHLKRLEEQAVLKTEEKEREWKKLEIRKRASFLKLLCVFLLTGGIHKRWIISTRFSFFKRSYPLKPQCLLKSEVIGKNSAARWYGA